MKWIDEPLWSGNKLNYWVNPKADNELLALEIPTGRDEHHIYMVGSIGERGMIIDGWGDDAGCTIFDVSKWAIFDTPSS